MEALQIKPDIYWVGAVDWDVRNFHGYKTQRGTTYNAYLLMDERITLVDTVKPHLFDEMMERVRGVVEPEKIDVVVSNHVEMDHSGSLPRVMELCPDATLVTSQRGVEGLRAHYGADWDFHPVEQVEEMGVGERTLQFHPAPMVHWPDSMETYVPEEALLLSNDGFGQHIASAERFVDELGLDIVLEEAAKYYANIVLPYGPQVQKLLEGFSGADVKMIATGHGLIWRRAEDIAAIVEAYGRWAANRTAEKAVIIFDTMWHSTERMADALRAGVESEGVPVHMGNLATTHVSDIMTELLEARGILVGSPTLNSRMFPTVAGAMTYIAGLRPRNRLGLAFGSYGWGKQGVSGVRGLMEEIGWEMPVGDVTVQWRPDEEDLVAVREAGAEFAQAIKSTDE